MTSEVRRRVPRPDRALPCAAWLLASAAFAQSAPPPVAPADSTIVGQVVVQGRSPQGRETFEKAVTRFLHDMGRPGPIGQVSRWDQQVCPIAAGLTEAMDRFVNDRIRRTAARVGAPGSGDCGKGANVMVVFTTRPDQLMADVRRRHEGMLGYHYVGETRSLAEFQPPMKSWYVTRTTIAGGDFATLDQAYAPAPPQGGSRIPPPLESQFVFVLVVVDANLLEGQAIGPVADRIAMLALSRPAPHDGCSALPSVMDLLEPGCTSNGGAEGLTSYDEAYLKALYAYKGSEIRYFERRSMARTIISQTSVAPPAPPVRRP